MLNDKKIKLKIVGEENDYSEKLKTKCKLLGIDNRVEFLGAVYKEEKNKLYSNAKFFVAPSYSEAIGMVNLEAAANKTPVLTTYNTGINSDWNKEGGIMINPNIEELVESINEAKAEEKKPTKEVVDMETRGFDYKDKKNIDNVYGEQFLKGFYTEIQDPKNEEKTVEELKSIVAKNLAKDQLHYVKDGQFGIKGVGYTTEAPGLGTPKEAKGK